MMALVQKDYKRLLAYHAISQVGYMILGIGTAVPAGIVGGLFHMINNALYKSCLFLTGGAVEKQTGTTNLAKLGGLAGKMPVTFGCFFIAAAAISGVPPFNGFFSKELIYDGALERGFMYYLAAAAGSFFTAASFLKLGHAAYFDKPESTPKNVKEAGWPMLLPVIILAALCILFGVYNALPIKNLIQPILGEKIEGHNYAGMPSNLWLVLISLLTLGGAMLNHWFGVKKSGRGLGASEHIHHAPILSTLYDKAEKRWFDPYEIGLKFAGFCAKILWSVDRAVDWIYEVFTVKITLALSRGLKALHNGNVSVYVLWSLVGIAGLLIYILR
jgi:NADH-quinone oxidoreductase subunit L